MYSPNGGRAPTRVRRPAEMTSTLVSGPSKSIE